MSKISKKILYIVLLALVVFAVSAYAFIREPQVAGGFYPADKKELSQVIDYNLSKYKFIENSGELVALISPHAGYKFSGSVAAYGYKQLTKRKYDSVIVIGFHHKEYFDGISVIPSGTYNTPLGEVEIDAEIASKLIEYDRRIIHNERAHLKEHSVEVQIPFLQKTLKNFKVVPVVFGSQTIEHCKVLSDAIVNSIGNKIILDLPVFHDIIYL